MKKTFTLSAVAVLLLAAASCEKEKNLPVAAEPITGHASFTATISAPVEDVKTTINPTSGSQIFRAGDMILVSNGAKNLSIADNTGALSQSGCTYDSEKKQLTDDSSSNVIAEWITVTDEMISDAGKTLTFDVHVTAPASYYNFFVTGPTPHIYSMTTGGKVVTRLPKVASTTRESQETNLIAQCGKSDTHISFKNTLAYVSFSSSGDYYAASIIANDAEFCQKAYGIMPDQTGLTYSGTPNSILLNGGVTAIIDGNHDTWLLPLTPEWTFNGGFTFILWSNASDYSLARWKTLEEIKEKTDWTGDPVWITTTSDFTPHLGEVTALGDVSSRVKYKSYYAKWQAGKNITIDGVNYNKNMTEFSGVTAERVTANKNISAAGVYFVADGVTVTLGGNISGSVIIMGDNTANKVGTRGAILNLSGKQFTAGDSTTGQVILKDLTITSYSKPLFAFTSISGRPSFVIDNCNIYGAPWNYVASFGEGAEVTKFAIIDSEIHVRQGIIEKNKVVTIDCIKFYNSVLYNKVNNNSSSVFQATSSRVGDFVMTGNTFINFSNDSSYNALDIAYVNSFEVTNNYCYSTNTTGDKTNFICTEANSYTIDGNHMTGWNGKKYGFEWKLNDAWVNQSDGHSCIRVDDQFDNLDLTATIPDFHITATTYGAQRDSQL